MRPSLGSSTPVGIIALLTALVIGLVGTLPATAAQKKDDGTPRVALSSTIVLKVSDRVKTADALIDRAESMDGYFTERTDDGVTLKVPVAHGQELIDEVVTLGKVVERSFSANDMGATLAQQRTLLKSRQAVLKRYFSVLNGASPSTIIEVEAEMTRLVEEIESLEGAIRMIEHQLAFAAITVRFEFRERRAPVRDGSSSFAWLNTMNLADLIEEFSHD